MKTSTLKFSLVALLAIAAFAALTGHPLVPPEVLAGLAGAGMLPLAIGETERADMLSLRQMIEMQGDVTKAWREKESKKLTDLEGMVMELAKKSGRPDLGSLSGDDSIDTSTNKTWRKEFVEFMRTGVSNREKAMSSGSGPAGGFLVPEQIDAMLSKYLRARSPMRQIANVVTVETADYKQVASTLGTGYSWVGEQESRPETDKPGLKEITIPTSEIYAAPKITQNLLDDSSFDLGAWLTQELTDAFGDGESDAFINGNGVKRPRGLFTYDVVSAPDASRAHDHFQYVPTGGAGAFASSNPSDALISLVYAVKPQYRTNAKWLMSGEVLEQVRKFKAASTNEYLWQPSNQAGQPDTLMGYPVYEDENIPAIGSNSLSAAFGDFARSYTITDRSTMLLRDPYSSKPYVVFYATKRLGGGGGRDTRAVKFLRFSTT